MEENILKEKYNDLLSKYNSGLKYIQDNPEKEEEAKKRLTEIENELSNIMEALPDMTEKEKLEGFVIEEPVEVKPVEAKKVAKTIQPKKAIVQAKDVTPVNNENSIIETTTGNIVLTPEIVKKYLVNGQGNVTEQEIALFIGMCRANKLNPFNKDAYLIKYSSEPATMVTSKDVFFKRANQNPNFDGMESGIVVVNAENKIEKRAGHIYLKNEQIIGAWCTVYRKDWSHPIYQEVNMSEYIGRKKSGEINSNWSLRPATMITKVAEATALRKAFTENLQGMYLAEETDNIVVETPAREQPTDIL